MTITIPGEKTTTLRYAVDHWIAEANRAIKERGAFFVALSGGSTPKAIFQQLAERHSEVLWERVWLFWSDERAVGPEHSDANYRMAMDAGLSQVGIPEEQIVHMEGERLDAEGYEVQVKKLVPHAAFDLIMLGMGDDGHTASLFPGTTALEERERLVVVNDVPQKQCQRLTFTYPLLEKARLVVLYVLGEGKAEMVHRILEKGESFPAGQIANEHLVWLLDEAAAAELKLPHK